MIPLWFKHTANRNRGCGSWGHGCHDSSGCNCSCCNVNAQTRNRRIARDASFLFARLDMTGYRRWLACHSSAVSCCSFLVRRSVISDQIFCSELACCRGFTPERLVDCLDSPTPGHGFSTCTASKMASDCVESNNLWEPT